MAGIGRSYSHTDLSHPEEQSFQQTQGIHNSLSSQTVSRPMSSNIQRPSGSREVTARPQTSNTRRLSFSLHDLSKPWSANTNLINGFYNVCMQIFKKKSFHTIPMFRHPSKEMEITDICTQGEIFL